MPVFPLYRNQSIDLLCKSIVWFLYEDNTSTWWVKAKISLYATVTSCKTERFNVSICYRTQKTHFGPTARFFPNKSFESILSYYTAVTSCEKNQKSFIKWFFSEFEKPHFGPIFCPFWLQIFKIKVFPKNHFVQFCLSATSCTKN